MATFLGILCAFCVEAESFKIKRDANWVPATPCTEVAPGSALDFSRFGFGFADGPCGKEGRIVARGEHFEFENRPGVPLRFMGVNFCEGGNYLLPDESRRLVDNLVRLGYNSIRLHHHDDAWWRDYLSQRRGDAEDEKCQKLQLSTNDTNENINLCASASLREKTNPFNPVKDNSVSSVSPCEVSPIARLDALMAACRERGVYVTTDLYVSRKVPWRDIGEDRDGNVGDFKVLIHFHDGALSNYLAYARSFLGHVNPYTGLRYADDPTLAWLSLVNEGNLGNWDIRPYRKHESLVIPKWRAWLAERSAENPEYAKVPDTLPDAVLEIPKDDRVVAFDDAPGANEENFSARAHVIAFQQFLASLEAAFLARMRAFLRDELGCRALVTNMNGWRFTISEQLVRDSFDYVDDHFYYAHPAFLGGSGILPAIVAEKNHPTNIGKADEFGAPYGVTRRLFGHPFTISEYNYCPPWSERASCAFLLGATAALQDWSALWRFCWTCNDKGAVDSSEKSLNHFDMAGDPVATLTERAIFCLFMRRDLPEHETVYPRLYPPSEIARLDGASEDPTSCHARWAAWRAKVGGLVAETPPDGTKTFGRFPEPGAAKTMGEIADDLGCRFGNVIESPDGAVRVDRGNGSITVDTPRTAGGFVEKPGVVETSGFRAEIEGGTASVWASSLDDRPIAESGRILVCLVGDVQNDGIEYEDETMCVLRHWGKQEGRIARRVMAEVSMALKQGLEWHVFALNPDGSRKREIQCDWRGGRLAFHADVAGDPNEAEFCYEIVSKFYGDTGKFTVATWNIGHFSLGVSSVSKLPAAEGDKWREAYRGFIDPVDARVVLVEEYSPHMDTEKTLRTPENVFGAYELALEGPSGSGGHVNSIFANDCTLMDSGLYAYSCHFQNTNFHYMLANIEGLETLVIATHLEPDWPKNHEEMRSEQISQLLEAVGDFPRVIIGGDWNVNSVDEWKPLADAGFTLANDGSMKTWIAWDPKEAIDSIIVKGFAVSDVRVHSDRRLSDHCMFSCSLTPTDRSKTMSKSNLPRYEPFLTTEERIVWKNTDIANIKDLSATLYDHGISARFFAKGVIFDRTPTSFTVQFQARGISCRAVRAYFRQKGSDIVAYADKAGFVDNEPYYGKRIPDGLFKHELATAEDNGEYGVCRIVPSASYPIVW